jgi:hypothetical protein
MEGEHDKDRVNARSTREKSRREKRGREECVCLGTEERESQRIQGRESGTRAYPKRAKWRKWNGEGEADAETSRGRWRRERRHRNGIVCADLATAIALLLIVCADLATAIALLPVVRRRLLFLRSNCNNNVQLQILNFYTESENFGFQFSLRCKTM